jgi:uncharacterized protein (DUF2147 family)
VRMSLLSPFITLTFLLALVAQAQEKAADSGSSATATPVGRWQTVDDATGKIASVVVLWEDKRQTFHGRIDRLVNPDPNDTDSRCVRCSGDLKDRNRVGLRIIWGLTKNGNQWSGGVIVNPNGGKAYRCSITVTMAERGCECAGLSAFLCLAEPSIGCVMSRSQQQRMCHKGSPGDEQ